MARQRSLIRPNLISRRTKNLIGAPTIGLPAVITLSAEGRLQIGQCQRQHHLHSELFPKAALKQKEVLNTWLTCLLLLLYGVLCGIGIVLHSLSGSVLLCTFLVSS